MNREQHITKELTRLCRLTETITDQPVVKIERTGEGYTNHTYRVHLENGNMVIARVAGEGTEEYIDRRAEHYNCCQMGFLGIAPKIIYCNEETGDNISRFIHAETMTDEDFRQSALLRGKAAEVMRTYHHSGLKFANDFSPFENMRQCRAILTDSRHHCEYDDFEELVQIITTIENSMIEAAIPTVPCHNDPLSANFLFDGEKMYVIDWEFSGMNDAYYDLAAFLVATELDDKAEEEFLTCYCNHPPTDHDRARLLLNKILVSAFEVHWTLMQLSAGKEYDTYYPYGRGHLDRAFACTQKPFYKEALKCIKKK